MSVLNLNSHDSCKSSFFETLDAGAVEVIVHHLSRKPHSVRWHDYLLTRDVFMLYSMGGSVSAICHQLFDSLCIGTNRLRYRSIILAPENRRDIPWHTISSMSRLAGTSFRHLTFSDNVLFETDTLGCLQQLGQMFPNVIDLEVSVTNNMLDIILQSTCSRLHSLNIVNNVHFQLDLSSCLQLRVLSIRLDPNTQKTSVWKSVGSRLERLKVSFLGSMDLDRSLVQIEEIQVNCRGLRHAHIEVEEFVGIYSSAITDSIVACYASYGAQLQSATAVNITQSNGKLLRESCPNLKLSLLHDAALESLVLALCEVSTIVEELNFEPDFEINDDIWCTRLRDVLYRCNQLKKISLMCYNGSIAEMACSLIAPCLPQLTFLEVITNGKLKSLFNDIANAPSRLERLKVRCSCVGSPDCWKRIVSANPNLETVFLAFNYFDFDLDMVLMHLAEIGRQFSKAEKLRELNVNIAREMAITENHLTLIKDIWNPFRFRRIHAKIGNYVC